MTRDAAMEDREEAFQEVLRHRAMLKAYLLAIVHDPFLAEDALSETTLEIARCWAEYDPLRPFGAWARGVARRIALATLRKHRKRLLVLDDESLELIAFEVTQLGDESELDHRKGVLRECLEKLPALQRELVQLRYFENRPYEQITSLLGKSVKALYVMLHRTIETLSRCVRTELARSESR